MTGAGSATLLIGIEDGGFMGAVNNGYAHFGRNPTVENLNLGNQLQRMVEGGQIQSVESVAGKVDGAIGVSAVPNTATHDTIKQHVYNDGGTGFTTGRANSARIIAASQYLADGGGTDETVRGLKGVIPTDYELSFNQDGLPEYSLTMLYATEDNTIAKPADADITEPVGGGDAAAHSFSLDVDGTTITDLQQATLSFSNLYSYRFGPGREPIAATLARPEASLSATAYWDGPTRGLEVAYGSAGATTPATRLNSVTGEVDLTIDGTQTSTYTLPRLKPNEYDWDSLINSGDEDTQETYSFHCNGQVTVA